jgi:putative transposase
MSAGRRREIIEPEHPGLSIVRQCALLSISRLTGASIQVSMDGRGRWMDNVFIERLWRSLKYECVYTHAFETGSEARVGIGRRIDYYNADRPHSALGGRTPEEAYRQRPDDQKLAA